MKAKGVISGELEWKSSRGFFYWRIRRRQAEDKVKDRLIEASGGDMSYAEACERVAKMITCSDGSGGRNNDKEVFSWIEGHGDDIGFAPFPPAV